MASSAGRATEYETAWSPPAESDDHGASASLPPYADGGRPPTAPLILSHTAADRNASEADVTDGDQTDQEGSNSPPPWEYDDSFAAELATQEEQAPPPPYARSPKVADETVVHVLPEAPSTPALPPAEGYAANFILDPTVPWRTVSHKLRHGCGLFRRFEAGQVEDEYQRYAVMLNPQRSLLLMLINAAVLVPIIPIFATSGDSETAHATLPYAGATAVLLIGAALEYLVFCRGRGPCARFEALSASAVRQHVRLQVLIFFLAGTLNSAGNLLLAGALCSPTDCACHRTNSTTSTFGILAALTAILHPLYALTVNVGLTIAIGALYLTVSGGHSHYSDFIVYMAVHIAIATALQVCSLSRDNSTRHHFMEMLKLAVADRELTEHRNRIATIVRCAIPSRLAERLASVATLQIPREALSDCTSKGTVCITAVCDFNQWCTGMLAEQIVSALHHLFTVFDAATAVFGVDKGGTSGDQYVVTAGLLRGTNSNAAHAAFFALWQQCIPEARVVKLRSFIATGGLTGGITGGTAVRYIVSGQALDIARSALDLVPPGMAWCTKVTLRTIARHAPGLFAACPEVDGTELFSLHPTSSAMDDRRSVHDETISTVRTEHVAESVNATKLWLSGYQRAQTLTESRRSAAFIVGRITLDTLNNAGMTVVDTQLPEEAQVFAMVDFAHLAFAGVGEAERGDNANTPVAIGTTKSATIASAAASDTAWQRPHQPSVYLCAGTFVDAVDEAAYQAYTVPRVVEGTPRFLAGCAAFGGWIFVVVCWEAFLEPLVFNRVMLRGADNEARIRVATGLAIMAASVVYCIVATLVTSLFASRYRALLEQPVTQGERRPVPPPYAPRFIAVAAVGIVLFGCSTPLLMRFGSVRSPLYVAFACLPHFATSMLCALPWLKSFVICGVVIVPVVVASIMHCQLHAALSLAGLVAAAFIGRVASHSFREWYCVVSELHAKAAAVQGCLALLQQLASSLLPPHVIQIGLAATDYEASRRVASGEAAMRARDQLQVIQNVIHNTEPTDCMPECIAIRVRFHGTSFNVPSKKKCAAGDEEASAVNSMLVVDRWAQLVNLVQATCHGRLQLIETLGDTILLAGPFGASPDQQDDALFEAAYAAVLCLHALNVQLGLHFTATGVMDEAYGTLLGRGALRYAVLGVAPRHAHALLEAAPRADNGVSVLYMTRALVMLLLEECGRRRIPFPSPLPAGGRPHQRWAVRSLGLLYVWPIVFPALPTLSSDTAAPAVITASVPS
jgi:class 3 adenylate cyclase